MSLELEEFNAELKRIYAPDKLRALLGSRAEDDFLRRLLAKAETLPVAKTKDTK